MVFSTMGFTRTLTVLLAAGILTGCAARKPLLSANEFTDLAAKTLAGNLTDLEITDIDSLSVKFDWNDFAGIAEIEEEYEAYLDTPRRLEKILAGLVQELLDFDISSVEPRPLDKQYLVPVFLRFDYIEQMAVQDEEEGTVFDHFLVTEYAPGLYLAIVYYKDYKISLVYQDAAKRLEMEPDQMYRWAENNIKRLSENQNYYTEGDSTYYYIQGDALLGASMLLTPGFWEDLPVDNEHLVFAVPTTPTLLFADRRSRAGMAELIRKLNFYTAREEVYRFQVSDRLYELVDGRIVEYSPLNLFKPGLGGN